MIPAYIISFVISVIITKPMTSEYGIAGACLSYLAVTVVLLLASFAPVAAAILGANNKAERKGN